MKKFSLSTKQRSDMVDITQYVQKCVDEARLKSGVVHVFVPHTTAGISINENADPDVVSDVMFALQRAVPNEGFMHYERNSDSHTKAQLTGVCVTVIVEEGKLVLGTWQSIYFCEFDGPRRREVYVQGISC